MPVTADFYYCTSATGNWKNRGTSSSGKAKSSSGHAERNLVDLVSGQSDRHAWHIEQNAFPCSECHAYLAERSQSLGVNIVVKVTDDHGGYMADHGTLPIPSNFYYSGGNATINPALAPFRHPPV